MNKWVVLLLCFWVGKHAAYSQTNYNPLSVYRGGILLGAVYSLNPELRENSEQFLKASFNNRISVHPQFDMVADVNWHIPGGHYGFELGGDFYLLPSKLKPYLGFGVGTQYYDKYAEFGKNIGALFGARFGVLIELSSRLDVLIQVPYSITTNADRDQTVGLQLGFLLSDGLRHVQKISLLDL